MATESPLQAAIALHQAGQLAQAIQAYQALIAAKPDDGQLHGLLGAAYLQTGAYSDAQHHLRIAVTKDPANPEHFYNLGLSLQNHADFNGALEAYQQAIHLKPNFVSAHGNYANVLRDLGRYEEAQQHYQQAINLNPRYAIAHFNRGVLYEKTQRDAEASKDYQAAIAIEPNYWDAHCNLANLEAKHNNRPAAIQRLTSIVAKQPNYLPAQINLAELYKKQGNYFQARECFENALTLDPHSLAASIGLAQTFYELNYLDAALAITNACLEKNPKAAAVYGARANIYLKQKLLEAAIQDFRHAVSLAPTEVTYWLSLGFALKKQGNYQAAIEAYHQGLKGTPESSDCQFNLAICELLLGNYKEGLQLYEKRHTRENLPPYESVQREFECPLWLGDKIIQGKSLLISSEQGMGDTIQCLRYIPFLKKLGAKLIVEVPKPLIKLVHSMGCADKVVEKSTKPPHADYYLPIMSLPLAFNTTLETIPNKVPYLATDPDKEKHWRKWLGTNNKFRLGLVWRGSGHPGLVGERDIALGKLLAQIPPEMEIISLQPSLEPDEMSLFENDSRLRQVKPPLSDFTETAALITQLDLVVSVDTAVAHLAGALGCPVWILLTEPPDWRWLLKRDDSPWYPTATLLRQHNGGEWEQTLVELNAALRRLGERNQADINKITQKFDQGNLAQAMAMTLPRLALQPNNSVLYNIAGAISVRQGEMKIAIKYLSKAVELDDKNPMYYYNLGLAYDNRFETEQAINAYQKALQLNPNDKKVHCNLAKSYLDIECFSESLRHADQAISIDPNYAQAKINKSIVLLLQGNYAEGLACYEYRMKKPSYSEIETKPKDYTQPQWDRSQPINGKTILITHEQGLGDALMFCRYVPLLHKMGATVVVQTKQELMHLFKSLHGVSNVISEQQGILRFDYHCPIGSLPYAFGTTLETIPSEVPYLFPDLNLQDKWRTALGKKTKPRVGLVWRGHKKHKKDIWRSIKLNELVKALPKNIDYVVLQKDLTEMEKKIIKQQHLREFDDQIKNWQDTAALITQLDLVISVDTSVAHCAGALAKPTWVLLPFSPDWRWMLTREDSPWYPTLRLFRQTKLGEWPSVLKKVATALNDFRKSN